MAGATLQQSGIAVNSVNEIVKLNPQATSILYTVFLGNASGTGFSGTTVTGAVTDPSGNSYITGNIGSTGYPTKNAFQATLAGGVDGFLTKLDPNGNIVYSTYLGGSGSDGHRRYCHHWDR